jgi:hypothetical protein
MKRRIAGALLALAPLFALSGTAMARNRYLITSTNQISPSVLAKLKGRSGPQGPAGSGPLGPQGLQGIVGPIGLPGERGPQGPVGPAGEPGPPGVNGNDGIVGERGASGPAGAAGATGATGATSGLVGPAGSNGANGSNGSGGTGGSGLADRVCTTLGLSPNDVTNCFLKEKFAETGTWSASIAVPNGGPQQQANGVVSFNPKYPTKEVDEALGLPPATLTLHYRNEAESQAVIKPCLGSVNEPQAEKGNLCVYRGAQKGKETEDTNIKEPNAAGNTEGFSNPFGVHLENGQECPNESGDCQTGVLVIFRTAQFAEPRVKVTAESYLNAFGSWAVTAN